MTKPILILCAIAFCACSSSSNEKDSKSADYKTKALEVYNSENTPEDIKKSIAYLDSAIALNPNSKEAYTIKSEVLKKAKNSDDLIAHLEKTNKSFPDQPDVILSLAMEFDLRGDSVLAQNFYAQLVGILNNTLDTLPKSMEFFRNPYSVNLSQALLLRGEDPFTNRHIATIAEKQENIGFVQLVNSLKSMPREELLARMHGSDGIFPKAPKQ